MHNAQHSSAEKPSISAPLILSYVLGRCCDTITMQVGMERRYERKKKCKYNKVNKLSFFNSLIHFCHLNSLPPSFANHFCWFCAISSRRHIVSSNNTKAHTSEFDTRTLLPNALMNGFFDC